MWHGTRCGVAPGLCFGPALPEWPGRFWRITGSGVVTWSVKMLVKTESRTATGERT